MTALLSLDRHSQHSPVFRSLCRTTLSTVYILSVRSSFINTLCATTSGESTAPFMDIDGFTLTGSSKVLSVLIVFSISDNHLPSRGAVAITSARPHSSVPEDCLHADPSPVSTGYLIFAASILISALSGDSQNTRTIQP